MIDPEARIRFLPGGETAVVESGSTIAVAAEAAGVAIDQACAGLGRCGSCRVTAHGTLSPPGAEERSLLGEIELARGVRLACRARILGDTDVTVGEAWGSLRVVETGPASPFAVEPPANRGITVAEAVGAAVDLGTTTIVVNVHDLATGALLGTASGANPQAAHGADVLSRVTYALAAGAERLRGLAAEAVEKLLVRALDEADVASERLAEVAVVGNTAMIALLTGQDVAPLAAAPYDGVALDEVVATADTAGLDRFAGVRLYLPPRIAAFVGSDIVAGILVTGLADDRGRPTLFVDLGTNGEIVLASRGRLLATSTAAGPALEGAALSSGMRAASGAIERVWLEDGDVRLEVIGDRRALGICGSGALDLVAALREAGAIDESGRMGEVGGPLDARWTKLDGGVRAFVLDASTGVMFTQHDVRQVQLAKGAVRAGVELLLDDARVSQAEVIEVIIAGGFGQHVRADTLAVLGVLPDGMADRARFAGNTALAGAAAALLSSEARAHMRRIAAEVGTVDLASSESFQRRFVAALAFPA